MANYKLNYGLEIEACDGDQTLTKERLSEEGLKVEIVGDGSIFSEGDDCEYVSGILTNIPDCLKFFDIVNENNSFNNSCGLHVHISLVGMYIETMSAFFKALLHNMKVIEDIIYRIFPERQHNRFCRMVSSSFEDIQKIKNISDVYNLYYCEKGLEEPLDNEALESLKRSTKNEKYMSQRYRGLNLHSFFYRNKHDDGGTIEFRYMPASDCSRNVFEAILRLYVSALYLSINEIFIDKDLSMIDILGFINYCLMQKLDSCILDSALPILDKLLNFNKKISFQIHGANGLKKVTAISGKGLFYLNGQEVRDGNYYIAYRQNINFSYSQSGINGANRKLEKFLSGFSRFKNFSFGINPKKVLDVAAKELCEKLQSVGAVVSWENDTFSGRLVCVQDAFTTVA